MQQKNSKLSEYMLMALLPCCTSSQEPFLIFISDVSIDVTECWQVRLLEEGFLKYLSTRGVMPLSHKLVSDPVKCIKDVSV